MFHYYIVIIDIICLLKSNTDYVDKTCVLSEGNYSVILPKAVYLIYQMLSVLYGGLRVEEKWG